MFVFGGECSFLVGLSRIRRQLIKHVLVFGWILVVLEKLDPPQKMRCTVQGSLGAFSGGIEWH